MAYFSVCPPGTILNFAGIVAPDGWAFCQGQELSRTDYAALFAAVCPAFTATRSFATPTTLTAVTPNPSTTNILPGMPITGTGIPAGATVTSVSSTSILISASVTSSGTGLVYVCPFGVGNGSTTFNLPDMRGVFPRGSGTNGTVNYGGLAGHTPAGGAIGVKGRYQTSRAPLSLSGSVNIAHSHGDSSLYFSSASGPEKGGWAGWQDGGLLVISDRAEDRHVRPAFVSSAVAKGQSLGQTSPSLSLTFTGDAETTPAFLAVNYIIRL